MPLPNNMHPLALVSPDSVAYAKELHSRIQFFHSEDDLATFITNPSVANISNKETGERPIHIAARFGHLSAMRLLYRRGANLNSTCKQGNTALHVAVANNNYWCSRFLITRGILKDRLNDIGIPAWAGTDGTALFPNYLKALETSTSSKMVSVALELLSRTHNRVDLDEYLKTLKLHKALFPQFWRKSLRKKAKQVKKLIKRSNLKAARSNKKRADLDLCDATAESVFAKIRNSMNDKLEKIIHVFRRFDTDDSGEIDRKELLYGLRELNVRLNKEQIKVFIETIDPNNDGSITFAELKRALKPSPDRNPKSHILPQIVHGNTKLPGTQPNLQKSKSSHKRRKKPSKSPKIDHKYRTVVLHEEIGGPVSIQFDDAAEKTSPYFNDDVWNNTLPGIVSVSI